jgi:DNA-binding SARP family transcriptional activator/tetratricopeptide (TPR) repeat protein
MVRIRTLGECVIEVGENRIGPDSKVVFAILLYLGLQSGKAIPRTKLIEMLWPDSSPEKAAHSLRQTIYQCRKLGAALEATKADVCIPEGTAQIDVESAAATETIEYARDFLPGYSGAISETFSEWIEERRASVMGKLRRAMITRLAQLTARGHWEAAERSARALLGIDPLNEEATLVLAESTAMRGNKVEALNILDVFASEVGHDSQLVLPANVLRRRIHDPRNESSEAIPLVGRSELFEQVSQQLRSGRRDNGSVTLLHGPAGIGKTRALVEIAAAARLSGYQVCRTECHPGDASRPMSAFSEAIPHLMQLRGALGCSPQSLGVLRRLTDLETKIELTAVRDFEGYLDLTGHLRSSLLDLFEAVTTEAPLLVLVDDVHWLDRKSWELFCGLSKWCNNKRIVVYLTSRAPQPESATDITCDSMNRILLEPLSVADSEDLFQRVGSGTYALSDDDKKWSVSVARGNPFFISELARYHSTTGKAHVLPPSLEGLLRSRVQLLSASSLHLLQVITLLGRHSNLRRIQKILDEEGLVLFAAFQELESAALIRTDEDQVVPTHALVGDNAVGLCASSVLRLMHYRIAQVLEPEVLETHAVSILWTCADHWRLAGESQRATNLSRICATQLLSIGLAADAAVILEDARREVSKPAERVALLRDLAFAYKAKKDWTNYVRVLQEVISSDNVLNSATAAHSEDELRLIEAQWFVETDSVKAGQYEPYLARVLECVRTEDCDLSHRFEASRCALAIADNVSDTAAMDEVFVVIRPHLKPDKGFIKKQLWIRLIYESIRGDLDSGVTAALELISLIRQEGNFSELMTILRNAAIPLRYAGRFSEAEAFVGEAVEMANERQLWTNYADSLDTLATLFLEQNKVSEAKKALTLAHAKAENFNGRVTQLSLTHMSFRVALAEGDIAQAGVLAEPSADLVRFPVQRYRAEAIAIQIIYALMSGGPLKPEFIQDLENTYDAASTTGRRDLSTVALVASLRRTKGELCAAALYRDYLENRRRERYPVPLHFDRIARS